MKSKRDSYILNLKLKCNAQETISIIKSNAETKGKHWVVTGNLIKGKFKGHKFTIRTKLPGMR